MKENQKHDSFGMIRWSRTQGSSRDLFGSSIEHHNTVCLTISKGEVERKLNRDWYYSHNEIIEVEMSPIQFSEFLTSPNTSGHPCTIRYTEKLGVIQGVPIESKRKVAEDEFKKDLEKIASNFQKLEEFANYLSNKSTINKLEKDTLKSNIFEVKRIIEDHIPFAQMSFNEQLDKSVAEARSSIEAFVEGKIRDTGLEALRNEVKLLEK